MKMERQRRAGYSGGRLLLVLAAHGAAGRQQAAHVEFELLCKIKLKNFSIFLD
jgi:hypothetical protein